MSGPMPVTVVYPWTDRERAAPVADVRAAAEAFPGEPMRVRLHPATAAYAYCCREFTAAWLRWSREPNARGGYVRCGLARLFGMPVELTESVPCGRVEVGPNAVLVGVLPE